MFNRKRVLTLTTCTLAVVGLALVVLGSLGQLRWPRGLRGGTGADRRAQSFIDTTRIRQELEQAGYDGVSEDMLLTLSSLEKIDDYPIYTMTYFGPYVPASEFEAAYGRQAAAAAEPNGWACSLFAAIGDPDWPMLGRNFDWEYSPLLVVWLEPVDGHRSLVTVDLAYFFDEDTVGRLEELPADQLLPLLNAPFLTFDGMNEQGLAMGMASVDYECGYPTTPGNEEVGDLRLMRVVLEGAATVEEAVTLLEGVNPISQGGPNMHYMIADTTPAAALIEYHDGEMYVFRSSEDAPWQLGTNFPVILTYGRPTGRCWRYDELERSLRAQAGDLSSLDAVDLLEAVSTPTTQWSNVYDLTKRIMYVAVGRDYGTLHGISLIEKTAIRQSGPASVHDDPRPPAPGTTPL